MSRALRVANAYPSVDIPIRRSACPDNEMTQSSRLSSWPLSFDRICQTTHGYALGQRPLFGRSGHLWVNRATTSAPKAARQHPCGGRAAQRLAQVRSLNRSEPFGATYGFAVRREPAPYVWRGAAFASQARHVTPAAHEAVARFVMCQRLCRLPTCTFMFRAPYAPQGASFGTLGQVRAVQSNALRSRERRFEPCRGHCSEA